jgi:hypothetical protein
MAKGRKTGGRRPGSANKITRTVKEVFEKTFRDMQADPDKPHALAKWAEIEPGEFYKLAAKLIPAEIKGDFNHTVTPNINSVVEDMTKKK